MAFELRNVGLVHPNGHRALAGVTLSAARGERIAIIGPSGAGKTSLIRILGASLRPTDGTVSVLGAEPWQLGARELRHLRSRIGVVHQSPPIPARQRVITAVIAGRLGQWPAWKSMLSLLYPMDIAGPREQLARLDLADRLFERCDRLSGGQLQRVGIARVLYQQPEMLLADEPVSALDPALAHQTLQVLCDDAKRRGATLVASLHAVDLALRHFPRVVGVKEGAILFDLPAAQVSDALLRELYAAEGGLPLAGGLRAPEPAETAGELPPLRCA